MAAAHPRFHMHFTPAYSSWMHQVERFFAHVTADLLQRPDHRSVQALEADIRNWVKAWTRIPGHSSGPRPPNRSSPHSGNFYNELPARDTSATRC